MPDPITIIGGNIAGLSAAYHLSRNGCPVTIYERRVWDKPCGGAVSIEFGRYLTTRFGIDIPALREEIPPVRLCFANDRYVETAPLFVIVSRQDLQNQLIHRLEKETNIRVIFKSVTLKNSTRLSAQTIMAAGFSGLTRQIMGNAWHQREYALALKYTGQLGPFSGHHAQLMFFDSRLKGYGWVFCDNHRQVNAGIGGLTDRKMIHRRYENFIRQINNRFGYGIPVDAPPVAWKIPIVPNLRNTPVAFRKNGIEFIGVGDALGLAHPVVAAGIEPAWQSGWVLGESYDRSTRSINTDRYRRLLKKNLAFTSRQLMDSIIAGLLRRNWIPFKDPMSYALMKLFHKQITAQIKKNPWFAMIHDGNKKIEFIPDVF